MTRTQLSRHTSSPTHANIHNSKSVEIYILHGSRCFARLKTSTTQAMVNFIWNSIQQEPLIPLRTRSQHNRIEFGWTESQKLTCTLHPCDLRLLSVTFHLLHIIGTKTFNYLLCQKHVQQSSSVYCVDGSNSALKRSEKPSSLATRRGEIIFRLFLKLFSWMWCTHVLLLHSTTPQRVNDIWLQRNLKLYQVLSWFPGIYKIS